MRVLTSLDISKNDLCAEGTKLLAAALKSNKIMTALNISSNDMTFDGEDLGNISGLAALADAIPCMRALSTFTFSGDNEDHPSPSYDSKPVTMETAMTEADFSGKDLGKSGAIMAAAFLPKCT
jgi:hypothetical protein